MASEEADLNVLICKHLELAGLSKDCLEEVCQRLSSEAAISATASSDLSRLFAHVQDGSLQLVVTEMSGKEHSLAVNSSMSVADLKDAIAENHGPPRKRQRLVYGETILANLQTLASYMVSPLKAHLSLLQVSDCKIYVFGGHELGSEEDEERPGEIFDLHTGKWTVLPEGEGQPSASEFDDGDLSVVAGRDATVVIGWEDNFCRFFKPSENVWRRGPFLPNALTQSASVQTQLVALKDRLFVVGEVENPESEGPPQRMVFELIAGVWRNLSTATAKRLYTSVVATSGKLYIIGGTTEYTVDEEEESGPSNTVEAYDLESGTWSVLQPMTTARLHPGVVVLNDKIFVAGGEGVQEDVGTDVDGDSDEEPESDTRTLSSCEVYDPAVNRWTDIPDMPTARSATKPVIVNGELHVIGGRDGRHDAMRTVDIFSPNTAKWTQGTPMLSRRANYGVSVVQE